MDRVQHRKATDARRERISVARLSSFWCGNASRDPSFCCVNIGNIRAPAATLAVYERFKVEAAGPPEVDLPSLVDQDDAVINFNRS